MSTYPMLNYRLGNTGQEEMVALMKKWDCRVEEEQYMFTGKKER